MVTPIGWMVGGRGPRDPRGIPAAALGMRGGPMSMDQVMRYARAHPGVRLYVFQGSFQGMLGSNEHQAWIRLNESRQAKIEARYGPRVIGPAPFSAVP